MNKQGLSIAVVALALLLAGLWAWRSSAHTTSPVVQTAAAVESPDPPKTTEFPTLSLAPQSEERAPIASAEVVAAKPAGFGLIRVLVQDKVSNQPLRGARVTATYETVEQGHRIRDAQVARGKPFESITSRADGRVEIEMPPGVESRVNASGREIDAGFADTVVPALAVGEVREIVLRLPTENDLPFWMKLVEEGTLVPIPWASVTVSDASRTSSSLTTDVRGLVFCSARSWSITTILVAPEHRAHLCLEPEPGHATVETALVVTVPAAGTLRVEVTDASGKAVRDAKVVLTTEGYHLSRSQNMMASLHAADPRWSEKTDEAGIATLIALPVRVPLRGSLSSPKPWSAAEPLVLAPGETRSVSWKLSGGATLRGLVIDQHEEPVTDRSIWLRPAERKRTAIFNDYSSGPTRTTKTNADGRFEFEDVDAGDWSVGPSAPSVTAKVSPDDVAALAQYVEVVADQKDVEVTIRVDRGLFIRGRVLAPDGKPPRWGAVQASDPVTRLSAGAQLDDGQGTFEIGPLMAGRYLVGADGHSYAPSDRVEVEAGTDGVELRLNAGGTLAGRVVGLDGTTLQARVVVSQRHSKTARSTFLDTRKGAFNVDGLEAGTFDLAASTTDGSVGVLEGIVLGPGEARNDLTITVAPGGRVRVQHAGPDTYVGITILQRDILFGADGVQRGTSRQFVAPAGRVTVRASYYDDNRRQVDRIVDVKPGEVVDVTFEKGAR